MNIHEITDVEELRRIAKEAQETAEQAKLQAEEERKRAEEERKRADKEEKRANEMSKELTKSKSIINSLREMEMNVRRNAKLLFSSNSKYFHIQYNSYFHMRKLLEVDKNCYWALLTIIYFMDNKNIFECTHEEFGEMLGVGRFTAKNRLETLMHNKFIRLTSQSKYQVNVNIAIGGYIQKLKDGNVSYEVYDEEIPSTLITLDRDGNVKGKFNIFNEEYLTIEESFAKIK